MNLKYPIASSQEKLGPAEGAQDSSTGSETLQCPLAAHPSCKRGGGKGEQNSKQGQNHLSSLRSSFSSYFLTLKSI